jgi:serine/threonine protein phosphatase 1
MRTFVIGDIHGCAKELQRLYKMLPIQGDDRLVFLGDYVDRGPNARGVVDFILGLDRPYVALKGNHEAEMLDCLSADFPENLFEWLLLWGGDKTLMSYGVSPYKSGEEEDEIVMRFSRAMPEQHKTFYENLQLIYEDDNCICVHAGLNPLFPKDRDEKTLLWIRDEFINSKVDFGKRVVFGHTPQESGKPHVDPYKIGVDTGCYASGILTAVLLDGDKEPQFFQTHKE